MTIRIEDLEGMDFSDVADGEKRIPPTHPGLHLKEMLEELGLSQTQLASAIGVSRMQVSYLVNCKRPVTADMSLRLGLFFSQGTTFWLNLQKHYDVEVAMDASYDRLRQEITPLQAA